MIRLKYVENPFSDDYLYSFNCLRGEKKFYDCINRAVICGDEAFQNLEYSFYTYLLLGDRDEWIGYVLFHNPDLVEQYIDTVNKGAICLLDRLIEKGVKDDMLVRILSLKKEILLNNYTTTSKIIELDQEITYLENNLLDDYPDDFGNYRYNNFQFLYRFKDYYYLDLVIALPPNTRNDRIEADYFGFVKEVCGKVDELIQEKFPNIPIILINDNDAVYLIQQDKKEEIELVETTKIKSLVKDY